MKKRLLLNIPQILIFVIAMALIYAPVIVIFIMSFTNTYNISTIGLIKDGHLNLTFKWYQSLFTSDYSALNIASKYIENINQLKTAILNTFMVTIFSTLISTILGTLFAIGIHSFSKKIRTYLMLLNNMPVVSPDIVTGFLLLLVFVLFETIFGLRRGFTTVLLSHIFFSIPYVVLSVMPALNQIDPNTYDAARDLGCSRFSAVTKAIIPSILTGIITGATFAFTMSIDDFVITMFTSGTEFYNVSTWIDSSMRRGFIPKSVYAYNVIIFSIAMIVVFVSRLKSNKKIKELN